MWPVFRNLTVRRTDASLALITACLVVTGGCATVSQIAGTDDAADGLIVCEELRPEICTMDYNPVCGVLSDGGVKTYSNGCSACSDQNVTGYRMGACAAADE